MEQLTRREILLTNLRGHLEKYERGEEQFHWDILGCIYHDSVTGHKRVPDEILNDLAKEYPNSFLKLDLNGEFPASNWGEVVEGA